MNVTLPVAVIPTALTVLVWLVAICWPTKPATHSGWFDITGGLIFAFKLVCAVVGTLIVWLGFFIVLYLKAK